MVSKNKRSKDNRLDKNLPVKEREFSKLNKVVPRNQHQNEYMEAIENNKIVIASGFAGTGKTHLAVYEALGHKWSKKTKRIIITRPAVEAGGEKMGFLPGDLQDKLNPYLRPLFDSLHSIAGVQITNELLERDYIEIAPLGFMRGRAEPMNSQIPTPKGLRYMREIKIGDYVFGSSGQPVRVTGVYPQGKVSVSDVIFNDGTTIRCSNNHLWNTRTQKERYRNKSFITKSTEEIKNTIKNKHGHKNHEIPIVSAPVAMNKQEIPIDPYVLGCLLGDGTISIGSIHFCTADKEIIDLLIPKLPTGISIKFNKSSKTGYDYYITKDNNFGPLVNPLKKSLRMLGLWGCCSHEKFIPDIYLNNDSESRLEILRGLMDTDGSIFMHRSGKSRVEFYSISEQLAKDVKFLVESLGGVATLRLKNTPKYGSHKSGFGHNYDIYIVNIVLPSSINPFYLKRKANLFNPSPVLRLISDIKDAGEEECQCISVDAEDNLYLTNNFVVTHNTFTDCFVIIDEAQNATFDQLVMAVTRVGENCKMVINGDPYQSDLISRKGEKSGLCKLQDILEEVDDISVIRFGKQDVVRSKIVKDIFSALERHQELPSSMI